MNLKYFVARDTYLDNKTHPDKKLILDPLVEQKYLKKINHDC